MAENVGAVSFGVNLNGSGISSQINSIGSSVGSTFKNILSNAFSFALGQGFFSLIQSGFRDGIGAAINFDSQMQQNNISFTTMLGSATKAQQFMSWAQQFAASTPFSMDDVVTGSKRLLAFGFSAEQIPKMLQSIGDASSAMGMSGSEGIGRISEALGQMSAHGTVDAQDMMQLTSVGIPAWDILAKAMGKSTAQVMDMSSKGLIPANQAINALVDGMESRFPNMMGAQSKSFSGLMSTLKDNVVSTLGNIVKPQFESFSTNVLPKLISATGAVSDNFSKTGSVISAVGAGLKVAFGPQVSGAFTTIANGVQGSIGWIANHGTLVITVLGGIAGAMTAFKIATMAVNAVSAIHNGLIIAKAIATHTATVADGVLTTATGAQTTAQWALNAAFLANPITLIVVGIAALVAAFVILWTRCDAFRNFWINIWNGIQYAFGVTVNWIKSNWAALALFLVNPIAGAVALLYNNNPRFREWANSLGDSIRGGFTAAISWIRGLPGEALGWGRDIIMGIVDGIHNAAAAVGNAVKGIAQNIRSFLHFSVPDQGPLVDFKSWMPDFMHGLADSLTGNKNILINPISGMAMDLNSIIKTGINGTLGSIRRNGMDTKNTNSMTKSPIQNFYGPVNLADKGSTEATLHQIYVLTPS